MKKNVSKVKPVFVDVIADQETEAVFDRPVYRPDFETEDESEEGFYNGPLGTLDFEPTDNEALTNKKTFSELIEESENLEAITEKPEPPLLRKKPLKTLSPPGLGLLSGNLSFTVSGFYFNVKLTILIYPQGAEELMIQQPLLLLQLRSWIPTIL